MVAFRITRINPYAAAARRIIRAGCGGVRKPDHKIQSAALDPARVIASVRARRCVLRMGCDHLNGTKVRPANSKMIRVCELSTTME